jgi:hypothetical protein
MEEVKAQNPGKGKIHRAVVIKKKSHVPEGMWL